MADVSSITSSYETVAQEGFSTTLNGSISSGASSVTLNSTAGYSNGDKVVLVVDRVDSSDTATPSKEQAFYGEISGSTVINVVWTEGTNQTHDNGAVVEDLATATHWLLANKRTTQALDGDGALQDDVVTTDSVADGAIVPAGLTTGTGTDWTWQTWSPSYTDLTVGNGTVISKYIQIGQTIKLRFTFTLGSTSAIGATAARFSLPKTAHADYDSKILGQVVAYTTSGSDHYAGMAQFQDVDTIRFKTFLDDSVGNRELISGDTGTNIRTSTPFTWATGDILSAFLEYEIA